MKSMQTSLTARIVGGSLVILLVSGVLLGRSIHKRVLAQFDLALESKAKTFVMLTEREGQEFEFEFSHDAMPEFKGGEHAEYFQASLANGTVLARSDSLGEASLGANIPPASRREFRNMKLPDGRRGRAVQLVFWPRAESEDEEEDSSDSSEEASAESNEAEKTDDKDVAPWNDLEISRDGDEVTVLLPDGVDAESLALVIVMARGRESLDSMLLSLHLTLTLTGLVIIGFVAVLVYRTVRSGLTPIEEINSQLGLIGPEALDRRVTVPLPPRELHTILGALNSLLERLESAFERERRFSSNVAHELRTPVSELRTACEVGGKWPEDREGVEEFFSDIRETAMQMERIVANLLELSRCDNGTATVTMEELRLAPVIQECLDRVTNAANHKNLQFNVRVSPEALVCTDREKLEMIVQNLIDNAVTYAVPGTIVECVIDGSDSGFELIVENQAAEISKGDLDNIFERFWQKDPTRSGGEHAGLGLSIVKALCELLHINIHIELKDASTFQVRMAFA